MASDQVKAMRRASRAAMVSALQDGRKQRASYVPSGKTYRRKEKYGKKWDR